MPKSDEPRGDADVSAKVKQRRSERTRARIMDAAEEVFGRHGFHRASVVDITKAAGVGLGTFYLYFPSKGEIYRHLLRARQEEFIAAARRASEGAQGQGAIAEEAFRAFFGWIAERPMILRMLREAEFVDPSLGRDLYRVPADEFRERLARAMENGSIRSTDPEVLAWCLMGMAEFTALRWIAWDASPKIDERRFEAFVQIVSRALGVD